jgi:hypothetical protein
LETDHQIKQHRDAASKKPTKKRKQARDQKEEKGKRKGKWKGNGQQASAKAWVAKLVRLINAVQSGCNGSACAIIEYQQILPLICNCTVHFTTELLGEWAPSVIVDPDPYNCGLAV